MNTVAAQFPNSKFAIIDYSYAASRRASPQEHRAASSSASRRPATSSAGWRKELMAQKKAAVIGAVGGLKIPPVDHYIAGYQARREGGQPEAKVLYGYSQNFVDQSKCKEIALNQIAQGSQVVFAGRRSCGLGALDGGEGAGAWGIGVDADQAYLGAHMLTSAVKRVDVAFPHDEAGQGRARSRASATRSSRSEPAASASARSRPRCPQAIVAQEKVLEKQITPARSRASRRRSGLSERPDSGRGPRPAARSVPADSRPVESPRWLRRRPSSRCAGITKRFPGIVANDHVDFDLRPRRGARAAGRERRRQVDADEHPLRALPAGRGRDPARGKPVRFSSPRDAIAAGIGMVHQHFMLIPVMTVAENIVLGAEPTTAASCSTSARRRARVASSSRASASRSTRTRTVENISVGQQQRVEILKALYRKRRHPDPRRADRGADAAGGRRSVRDPARADRGGHVDHLHHPQARRGARDRRPDHRAAARQECRDDAAARRDRGRPRPDDGRPRGAAAVEKTPATPGEPCSRSSDLGSPTTAGSPAVRGVSFSVRAGEIVGIAGVDGNGQTELIDALDRSAQARAGRSGRRRRRDPCDLSVAPRRRDRPHPRGSPAARPRRSTSPSPRTSRSSTIATPPVSRLGWLNPASARRAGARALIRSSTSAAAARRRVRAPYPAATSRRSCSRARSSAIRGPDRRAPDPGPRRGGDRVRAPPARRGARRGAGDPARVARARRVLSLSDRILVIYEGRIVGEFPPTATQEELGLAMTGGTRGRRRVSETPEPQTQPTGRRLRSGSLPARPSSTRGGVNCVDHGPRRLLDRGLRRRSPPAQPALRPTARSSTAPA